MVFVPKYFLKGNIVLWIGKLHYGPFTIPYVTQKVKRFVCDRPSSGLLVVDRMRSTIIRKAIRWDIERSMGVAYLLFWSQTASGLR